MKRGVKRIGYSCPGCKGASPPLAWLPEKGLDPTLRAFQCKNCKALFYLSLSAEARADVDESLGQGQARAYGIESYLGAPGSEPTLNKGKGYSGSLRAGDSSGNGI